MREIWASSGLQGTGGRIQRTSIEYYGDVLRIRNHFERNVSGVVNNIKFLAVANGEAVHGVECAHPRGKRHDFESIAQGRFITTFEVDIERAVEGGGAGYRVAVKTGQAGDTDFQRAD